MSATTREPRCGMCRYPVRGLPTFRCPECGNDLRQVGIIATGVRAHATPWQRVGYWTLLFLVAAIPLTALADNLLRWRQANLTITLRDLSGARDVTFAVNESGYPGPFLQRDIWIDVSQPAGQWIILKDSNLTADRIGAALGPPDDPLVKQQTVDLLAMIKAAARDGDLRHRPPVYFEQRGVRYTGTGSGSNTSLILPALAILWTTGAWIAWRRPPRP